MEPSYNPERLVTLWLQRWTKKSYLFLLCLFSGKKGCGWGIYFKAEFLLQASPFNNNQRLKVS